MIEMAISMIGLIYLGACHYIPEWTNITDKPTRNPGCKMNLLMWNDFYAICFLIPPICGNLFLLLSYRWKLFWGAHPVVINDWLKRVIMVILIGAAVLTLVGYTTWFFLAVKMWKHKTPECTQGWNQLDMLNFMFLTAFTGWPAAVTVVLLLLSILMSPYLYAHAVEYWNNFGQAAEEQRDIINTIVRTNWDPETFKAQDMCSICMQPFNEVDTVTPLPCDSKHYFHSECIVGWFQAGTQTTTCPICRTHFTRDQMKAYSESVNAQIKTENEEEENKENSERRNVDKDDRV